MRDNSHDIVRIKHMLDAISTINQFIGETEYTEFEENTLLVSGCLMQLVIIGEAGNRISNEIREKNDKVAWPQIVALRNLVVHEYFGVDHKIIWDIIEYNLPELRKQLLDILASLDN